MAVFHEIASTLRCVSQPIGEPISLSEIKEHCGVAVASVDWDYSFAHWISAARQYFENSAQCCLMAQQWELALQRFPSSRCPIELHRWPIRSVDSMVYIDEDGTTTTATLGDYDIDVASRPGLIMPRIGQTWPVSLQGPRTRAVVVTFSAGNSTRCTIDAAADTLTPDQQIFSNGDTFSLRVSGGATPSGLASDGRKYHVVNRTATTIQLATSAGGDPVNITSAGTGTVYASDIPPTATQAIRMMVAHWWRNRESVGERMTHRVEQAWDSLIGDCREW